MKRMISGVCLPRKQKKAFKNWINAIRSFNEIMTDMDSIMANQAIINYVDPIPYSDHVKMIELQSEGRIHFQTMEMTMDEIHKMMGVPKEAFGKKSPDYTTGA